MNPEENILPDLNEITKESVKPVLKSFYNDLNPILDKYMKKYGLEVGVNLLSNYLQVLVETNIGKDSSKEYFKGLSEGDCL